MQGAEELFVDAEDLSRLDEGEYVSFPSLSPSDHLTDIRQEFEIRHLAHQVDQLQEQMRQDADRHRLRKNYSFALFGLVVAWVVIVWAIILLQGIGSTPKYPNWKFRLSDAVLIAFITSTTASVLGLFGIAAYWLFGTPKPKAADSDSKKPQKTNKKKPLAKTSSNRNP